MSCLPYKEVCRLVTKAQSGNEDAFTRLYEATSEAQFFSALSILKDASLAEDAIQIIYLQVYKNISKLTEPERFLSWLTRITYNTSLNLLRDKKRAVKELEDDGESPVLPDLNDDINPLNTMIQREDRKFLFSLLGELSLEHRTILIMRYYQELKVKEIAEIMGLSEGTVKSRIHYGLKKLRDNLKEHGFRRADGILGAGIFLRHSFRAAPTVPSSNPSRKYAGDCALIITACAVAGFLLVGAAKTLPAAELKNVHVDNPNTFTREDVSISVAASVKDVSQLRAAYENGEELPVVQKSARHFSLRAGRNGKVIVSVMEGNKIKDMEEITITQIDREKPFLDHYENGREILRAYINDDVSGVNFQSLEAFVNEKKVGISKTDEAKGYVEFPCRSNENALLVAEDLAGNMADFELEAVSRYSSRK